MCKTHVKICKNILNMGGGGLLITPGGYQRLIAASTDVLLAKQESPQTGVCKKKAPSPWEFSISLYILTSFSYDFMYAFCIFCIVFVCMFDMK